MIGALLGFGGAWALRRAALPSTGLYPLAAIAVCLLGFTAGQFTHASGLLATYVAALVLGNSDLPHRGGVRSFAEGTGWLAQIGLFVLLGLYASPPRLVNAVVPGPGRGRRAAAGSPGRCPWSRPPLPFRVPWREQAFLSWSGLRGAVPIVLALIALTEGAPSATALVDVVFVLVVVLTLLQGTTLPWVARLLGVARAGEPRELEVDAAPLDELGADLLQVRVPVGSRLKGVYLRELRLPRGADGEPRRARRRGLHPDAGDPAARTRPAARRHHLARAGARPRTGSGPSTCAVGWRGGREAPGVEPA